MSGAFRGLGACSVACQACSTRVEDQLGQVLVNRQLALMPGIFILFPLLVILQQPAAQPRPATGNKHDGGLHLATYSYDFGMPNAQITTIWYHLY